MKVLSLITICVATMGYSCLQCSVKKTKTDIVRADWFLGRWACDGREGGNTNVYSTDSVEIEIAFNQIWISSKISTDSSDYNSVNLYFKSILDISPSVTVNWDNFSTDLPIASFERINDSTVLKKYYGFHNVKTGEYEDLAFDWNNCDTLMRLQ